MADSLREVIKKMKEGNTQTSVPINPKAKPQKKPEEEIEEEFDESEDLEEEQEEEQQKPVKKQTVKAPENQENLKIAEKLRDLQDNGIYRLEKLSVLHQINNNLKIIAGVLVDLTKEE